MEYKSKRRKFEVKLESIDPTGSVIESEELNDLLFQSDPLLAMEKNSQIMHSRLCF